ncbi:MAG: capsular polysaccharide synthesis protein [Alphaproteobacteria bacterium]|nr:capsular polysaccharide synthesis protein [Alphaproteobacteria bacterium]
MVTLLESEGIIVREIDYLTDCLLCDLIEEKISEKLWGMASDILRVEIMKQEGGLYMDLNYILVRSLEPEMHKFDFFTQSFGEIYIDNFFFCSAPNHPILYEWLNNIIQKFTNPPQYIQTIIDELSTKEMTDMMTANPSFISYHKACNKDGNVDVIFPMNCETYAVTEDGNLVDSLFMYTLDGVIEERGFCLNLNEGALGYMFEKKGPIDLDKEIYDLYDVPQCLGKDLTFGDDGNNGLTWL